MSTSSVYMYIFCDGSQPYLKIMYNIELQTIFYKYQNKNHKINTSFVSPEVPEAEAYL